MHAGAYKFIEWAVNRLPLRKSVCELGSRTVIWDNHAFAHNGLVRPLFKEAERYIGVDIREGTNVDVIGNAADWRPNPPELFDTVVCCETLEHTNEGRGICKTAYDVLAPGGIFLVTAAGPGRNTHSCVDGGPVLYPGEFYNNVYPEMLAPWLEPFEFSMIDILTTPTDIYALATKRR
jgi:SAM-dependent methyltransferase